MILNIFKKILILLGLLAPVSSLAFTVMNRADAPINIELFCPKPDTNPDDVSETCWEADWEAGTKLPHHIDFGVRPGMGFTVPSFDCKLEGDTAPVKRNYFCALGNYTGSLTVWTTTNPLVSDPTCQLDFKWIKSKGKGGVSTTEVCECTAPTCKEDEVNTNVNYGPTIVAPSNPSTFIEIFPPSNSQCPKGHEVNTFFSYTTWTSDPVNLIISNDEHQYICLSIHVNGAYEYSNKPILNHQDCKITIEENGTQQYEGCQFLG
jgi:hypothetical protein